MWGKALRTEKGAPDALLGLQVDLLSTLRSEPLMSSALPRIRKGMQSARALFFGLAPFIAN